MRPLTALAFCVLSAGLAFPPQARADDPSSPPVPPPPAPPPAQTSPSDGSAEPTPPPHRHHMRPAYVLSELTEKLGLTPDEQKQVGAIIDSGAAQGKEVRADETLSRDDKRAKMGAILRSMREQIRAALTPDQQKLFDALPPPGARPKPPAEN